MRKAQNNLPIQAFTLAIFCLIASASRLAASTDEAGPLQVIQDISYAPGDGGYKGECCKLDLHLPEDKESCPVLLLTRETFIKELTQYQ